MKVNYNQIIGDVANETGYNQAQVREVINSFWSRIKDYMKKGFEVNILSFCKFKTGEASSRKMYNFQDKAVKPMPKRLIPKCEFVRKFKKEISE